jgi:hypothetical protein
MRQFISSLLMALAIAITGQRFDQRPGAYMIRPQQPDPVKTGSEEVAGDDLVQSTYNSGGGVA